MGGPPLETLLRPNPGTQTLSWDQLHKVGLGLGDVS